ncbi:dihydroxy-acid dehydratase [Striga asiatica]|uniref:Dihydroxy-acid dehydratase n=1 Tax=Striga asiatica TaxID=4170 RepID=A0A5A7PZH4_STRAF|nr:dihydroxy-acid dehydratase [Striga asiatica]
MDFFSKESVGGKGVIEKDSLFKARSAIKEKSSPASMPREPELLFDFPYPYLTVSTLKAIAFQVERLFKSVLSRLLVSKCLGPVRQLSSLPLSQVLSPVAASLPGLLRAMPSFARKDQVSLCSMPSLSRESLVLQLKESGQLYRAFAYEKSELDGAK